MFASLQPGPCDVRGLLCMHVHGHNYTLVLVNPGLWIFDGSEHDSNYIFVKCNSIVPDSWEQPKVAFNIGLKSQFILLFNLFLLLFMSPTALFGIIHGSYFTISANFYLYL